MTLEDDLVAWVATRPDWQQHAIARFCQGDGLSTDDIKDIADKLISGTYPSVPTVARKDIPGASSEGVAVRLQEISDVSGVNALLPGQRLSFGDVGLTVVYGDNGSGKSGYARMIRQAVTARVKAPLLPDVFASELVSQTASVAYTVAGENQIWNLGEEPNTDLSSLLFYDEECGDSYVTTAAETNYRPSALTLLDRLSAACHSLQVELSERLAANEREKPKLPLLIENSVAKTFLDSINASTTAAQVAEATTLPDDHLEQLAAEIDEESRLQRSDPAREKRRLSQLSTHWQVVEQYVSQLAEALSEETLTSIDEQKSEAKDLRTAAEMASSINFQSEPLEGIGSKTWRVLWAAARAYSVSEAYHGHDFPVVDEGAVCVLCQQVLREEGASRLARFDSFVSDTTSLDAEVAEKALNARRSVLMRLDAKPTAVTTALADLRANSEETGPVEEWLADAVAAVPLVADWITNVSGGRPEAIRNPPVASMVDRSSALKASSEAIDAATFAQRYQAVRQRVTELQALGLLAEAHDNLLAEISRLQERSKIEKAKRLTDTTGITRKSTELSTEHVTAIVRDQFTRETERLRLRRVTLNPSRGRRTATLEHQPHLLGVTTKAQVSSVLSEGEQTALGLAGFLTEVMFDESRSGVILDDPVSSLDARRRSLVACRIVELAQDRQVIVFTHEATFVTALNKEARDQGVEVIERAIFRQGEQPGKTANKHPWKVSDTKARVAELKAEVARLRRDRMELDDDEYTRRAQAWGGQLSQTWERAVNFEIVNQLVNRGTNEVHPRMFKMLPRITEQDDVDYQSGYAKASEWALRHDQAPEVNFVAPEPDELESELERLSDWCDRVKRYQK